MASIDLKTAAIILERAFTDAEAANDETGKLVTTVLRGSHKTYRYILVTALLAKAANNEIDPLSLQKGNGEDGKYDARSLCHKVVVPFETIRLPGSLGGSNEPFLNKPARFAYLSQTNAVRSGNDRQTLANVIKILSSVHDSTSAYKYLKSALSVMKELNIEYVSRFTIADSVLDISRLSQVVLDYVYEIASHTLGGETCTLIVSQLEQMYLGEDFDVRPHKVNESGASTKEIGDIDVYDTNGHLAYSFEVKDKDFSVQDVAHAVGKFVKAGLTNSFFIYGKNATFDKGAIFDYLKEAGMNGHYCCLISILHFSKLRIGSMQPLSLREFIDGMLKFAKTINAKTDTISTIKGLMLRIAKT